MTILVVDDEPAIRGMLIEVLRDEGYDAVGAENGAAALAYDATLVLVEAIRRAGATTGPQVRAALAETREFPGVTGAITIDAQRNAAKPAAVVLVRNGRAEFFQSISP